MNFASEEAENVFLESIQCLVCMEIYSDERKPCVLTCGHSLCLDCRKEIVLRGQNTCPKCRQPFVLDPNRLGINFDLLNTAITYMEARKKPKVDPLGPNVTNKNIIIARMSATQNYGFDFKKVSGSGEFVVGKVDVKSISYRAGLRNDDCIVEVNGSKIKPDMNQQDFLTLIYEYNLEINLSVLRGHALKFDDFTPEFIGSLKANKPPEITAN